MTMQSALKRTLQVTTAALVVIAGCKVGPNYQRPQMPIPDQFGESTTRPASRPAVSMSTWWDAFSDPILNDIIDDALRNNLNLRAATARIVEARAQRGVVAADWWPTVDVDGSYSRRRGNASQITGSLVTGSTGNTGNNGNGGTGGTTGGSTGGTGGTIGGNTGGTGGNTGGTGGTIGGTGGTIGGTTGGTTGSGSGTVIGTGTGLGGSNYSSLWRAGFDATWELDVFGGVSRDVEAANYDIQAAVEDRRDVQVTLLAEVARNYVDLRGGQRDLVITQNNLRAQRDTLNLTRERFRAGISSDLDVARAEAQVANTASQIPTLEAQIRQAIHRLGTLTGKDPQSLSSVLTPPKDLLMELPAVPMGMPSELLRNRPDVRRAERQLAASTARIGVATADLFPRFSLTGSYAWQANKAAKLFSDSSNIWSIGPAVSWPIFDAGRIRANIEVTNAQQEQALTTYENTVLTALEDVEDSLIAYDREQERRVALAQSVASNRRAVDLATQLYSRGLVDFLSVLDAQRELFTAEDLLVRSDTTVTENLIALYKAMGGGWDRQPAPVPNSMVMNVSQTNAGQSKRTWRLK